MRALTVLLAGCLLASAAPNTKTDDKPAVRELDLGIPGEARGQATEPTVITSKAELEKSIGDEDALKAILKAVNFEKEKLLLFQWAGSGQDRVTLVPDEDGKSAEVQFQYKRGLTRDLRQHKKVFVLPKDAKFKVLLGK